MSVINCSLVHNWSANGALGSIYETKAVIESCSFFEGCIGVCTKLGRVQNAVASLSDSMPVFCVDPINDIVLADDAQF